MGRLEVFIVSVLHFGNWYVEGGRIVVRDESDLMDDIVAARASMEEAERAAEEYVQKCRPDERKRSLLDHPLHVVNIDRIEVGAPVGERTPGRCFLERLSDYYESPEGGP